MVDTGYAKVQDAVSAPDHGAGRARASFVKRGYLCPAIAVQRLFFFLKGNTASGIDEAVQMSGGQFNENKGHGPCVSLKKRHDGATVLRK